MSNPENDSRVQGSSASDAKSHSSGEAGQGARSEEHPIPETQFKRRGLVADFWEYLAENKKWWLLPIIIGIVLLTLLVMVSSPALLPFIYTLF
jgi:hypothetical protein